MTLQADTKLTTETLEEVAFLAGNIFSKRTELAEDMTNQVRRIAEHSSTLASEIFELVWLHLAERYTTHSSLTTPAYLRLKAIHEARATR